MELHLRADKNLSRADAEALSELFRVAYETVSVKRSRARAGRGESMAYNRGDYRDKWRIERLAAAVRRKLGLDHIEPLSPWLLADAIPAHIFYPEDFVDAKNPATGLRGQPRKSPRSTGAAMTSSSTGSSDASLDALRPLRRIGGDEQRRRTEKAPR